jgi:hypothetical protein
VGFACGSKAEKAANPKKLSQFGGDDLQVYWCLQVCGSGPSLFGSESEWVDLAGWGQQDDDEGDNPLRRDDNNGADDVCAVLVQG